jgi:hypothetical protein
MAPYRVDPDGVERDGVDLAAATRRLLGSMLTRPWGQVSASVYEIGRLVVFAPHLTGHARRLEYLAETQSPAGHWGAPDGYALVPTLSATDALLCALDRDDRDIVRTRYGRAGLTAAAERGLTSLVRQLGSDAAGPDMPAREVIVASLVAAINARLDRRGAGAARLGQPPGPAPDQLALLTELVAQGVTLDIKLLHALEVTGSAAHGSATARPDPTGAVGASPAATAAFLGPSVGSPSAGSPSARYLDEAARRDGGPVGCTTPITVFERSWVLATLARAGLLRTGDPVARTVSPAGAARALAGTIESAAVIGSVESAARTLAGSLRAALGPDGAATGPGLPADADTTAVCLYALTRLGERPDPACLLGFTNGDFFHTWPGEQGVSTTVNAHVLDALGAAVTARPELGPRYRPIVSRVAAWLVERQSPDGYWRDRWHASDYYATACCVLALDQYGPGHGAALARAHDWVLATQRPDGSWGRWSGTAEETAYAVLTLARADDAHGPTVRALRAALPHLVAAAHGLDPQEPALWHDKDLYRPHAIVRATVLAAIHAAIDGGQGGARERRLRNVRRRTAGPLRRTQSLRATTDRC